MAFCARDLGDKERAERFFTEADRAEPWSGTWLNWALAKEQWGQPRDALALVEKALAMANDPPYAVLKARLIQNLGDADGGVRLASESLKRFSPLSAQDEYQLFWFRVAARMIGNETLAKEGDRWARKRADPTNSPAAVGGELPDRERTPGEDEL
jgi:tetratricopeptide (TPR) repeat protein